MIVFSWLAVKTVDLALRRTWGMARSLAAMLFAVRFPYRSAIIWAAISCE